MLEDGEELLEAVESEPGLYEYLNTQQKERIRIQGEERIAERRRQVGFTFKASRQFFLLGPVVA